MVNKQTLTNFKPTQAKIINNMKKKKRKNKNRLNMSRFWIFGGQNFLLF